MTKAEAEKLIDAIHDEFDGLLEKIAKDKTPLSIGVIKSMAYADAFVVTTNKIKKMIEYKEEKCPGCGKTFKDEMPTFCPDCGRKLKKD